MEVLGLIPAGGTGSRMGKIPCSKEVYPVMDANGNIKVVSENLIGYFTNSGISNIYFIIAPGKWDIPGYFGDGSEYQANIGYLIRKLHYGTPFTMDQAYPFVQDKIIALGFPDIQFKPEDAFKHLLQKLNQGNADIILGAAPCQDFMRSDMLDFDSNCQVKEIVIKKNRPDLKYGWFIAVWRPEFSRFMHQFLEEFLSVHPSGKYFDELDHTDRELYMGDVIQAAHKKGLKLDYLLFPDGTFRDLGTKAAMAHHFLK